MAKSQDQSEINFEQSLKQLESLVERLEQGQLPLQESINLFQQGINAAKQCHTYLSEAQQVVEQLGSEASNVQAGKQPKSE